MKLTAISTLLLSLAASSAAADLVVTFRDGAPKDQFTLTNTGGCATAPIEITFDLSPAPAGLIFDISARGAGVEVYQPFELTSGDGLLVGASDLSDGDQSLVLQLSAMAPGDGLSFTIDLDDTAGGREITVSGAEIAGAAVRVNTDGRIATGVFDPNGQALVQLDECIS